jgi:hypothetical protein
MTSLGIKPLSGATTFSVTTLGMMTYWPRDTEHNGSVAMLNVFY